MLPKILAFVSFTLEQMHSGREFNFFFFFFNSYLQSFKAMDLFHKNRSVCFTINKNMKIIFLNCLHLPFRINISRLAYTGTNVLPLNTARKFFIEQDL